jgi:hypothetical protein
MRIAQHISDTEHHVSLVVMAQRWRELADKAEQAADDEN